MLRNGMIFKCLGHSSDLNPNDAVHLLMTKIKAEQPTNSQKAAALKPMY